MQHVRIGKREFTGAERFEELSQAELIMVMHYQINSGDHFLTVLEIVRNLFGIPPKLIMKLTDVQAFQLGATVNFLFDPPKFEPWFIKMLPLGAGHPVYGPADGLENITFNELMHADRALDKFQTSGNPAFLDELIAILYRPARPTAERKDHGDIRIPFNPHHTAARACSIAKNCDDETRMAIRLNYVACRSLMAEYFPDLFPAGNPEETAKEKKAANGNWLDLAMQLARKEPALGNLHDIEKDDAYLVCRLLNRVIKEYNEMEAQQRENK